MSGSRRNLLALLLGIILANQGMSQDSLPKFTLYKLGPDKVLIQWKNTDTTLRQISIQQSADSLYRFKTVLTMPDPRLPENGTVITRPGADTMFYRIYLLYPKGRYLFSPSKLPQPEPPAPKPSPKPTPVRPPVPPVTKSDSTKNRSVPVAVLPVRSDTVSLVKPQIDAVPDLTPGQKFEVKKVHPKTQEPDRFIPSKHVFAHRDGYAFIELPNEWDLSQVEIRFFSENGQSLFDLKSPALRTFRVDKTNFYRAGWQEFEIWLKGKLVERNRFYLPLEF